MNCIFENKVCNGKHFFKGDNVVRSREELEREILAFKNIHRLSGSTDALKWVDMLT